MRWLRRRRGSSAIEFALCILVLVPIMGGIFDYGWFFTQYAASQHGIRIAARTASVWTDASTDFDGVGFTAWSCTAGNTRVLCGKSAGEAVVQVVGVDDAITCTAPAGNGLFTCSMSLTYDPFLLGAFGVAPPPSIPFQYSAFAEDMLVP